MRVSDGTRNGRGDNLVFCSIIRIEMHERVGLVQKLERVCCKRYACASNDTCVLETIYMGNRQDQVLDKSVSGGSACAICYCTSIELANSHNV